MTDASEKVQNEILIATWPKNKRETFRVSLGTYLGVRIISLRLWFRDDDGVERPGRSGISTNVRHIKNIVDALQKAFERARDLGWVDTEIDR